MIPGIDYIGISTPFYCFDKDGMLLMHIRSSNCRDEQKHWDTGSGQLEFGLTPEQNVLKEVKEEYGVSGTIKGSLPPHSIIRKIRKKQTHWLAIPFFILVNPQKVRINEPDKIDKIGWFTLSTLPKPLHTGFSYSLKRFSTTFYATIKS